MKKTLQIILLLALTSCGQVSKDNSVRAERTSLTPFQLTVTDYDYSMAYGLQYVLTEKDLKIVFKGELEGERDTVLFSKDLPRNETLKVLSELNLDSLEEKYENPCIADGSQILVNFKKNNKAKQIHLSIYYQKDIGLAIDLINKLTPDKHNIWYDKEELLQDQMNCK